MFLVGELLGDLGARELLISAARAVANLLLGVAVNVVASLLGDEADALVKVVLLVSVVAAVTLLLVVVAALVLGLLLIVVGGIALVEGFASLFEKIHCDVEVGIESKEI